jgi:cytochrome c553
METHAEVIDRLWLGLVGPSEEAWDEALVALPARPLAPGEQVPWHTAALDQQTHERLGKLARAEGSERYARFGELLVGCADCHLAGAEPPPPRLGSAPLDGLQGEMLQHAGYAAALERALVAGDLLAVPRATDGLRSSLQESTLPRQAQALRREVQGAAERAGAATTLRDAAQATAGLYTACGRCHRASGGGPHRELPAELPSPSHAERYTFGVSWMGYGLFAPDERAWTLGASALAPQLVPPDGRLPQDFDRIDASVHQLAQRAQRISEPAARAEIWGELISGCGPCHQQLP